MHAVTDHPACTAKGFDEYVLNPCDPRTPFTYPPTSLWLGYLGIDGTDSAWLAVLVTVVRWYKKAVRSTFPAAHPLFVIGLGVLGLLG